MKQVTYYAHTANFWAANTSIKLALRDLRHCAGSERVSCDGYEVVMFSRPLNYDEFDVHQVDGSLRIPPDVTSTTVELRKAPERRKKRAQNDA